MMLFKLKNISNLIKLAANQLQRYVTHYEAQLVEVNQLSLHYIRLCLIMRHS